jgi:hypothetical protein
MPIKSPVIISFHKIRQVLISASVRDSRGHPFPGLDATRFHIFDVFAGTGLNNLRLPVASGC